MPTLIKALLILASVGVAAVRCLVPATRALSGGLPSALSGLGTIAGLGAGAALVTLAVCG